MSTTVPQRLKRLTLVLVTDGDRVLLGMKKRGFGAGRWNGFGGKIEKGETAAQAAARELREEAGLAVRRLGDLERVGTLYFTAKEDPDALRVAVFRLRTFVGLPAETEEMRPQWFAASEIPYDGMWPDDKYWLPVLLSGGRFLAEFAFDGEETIVGRAVMRADPDWSLAADPPGWSGIFVQTKSVQAAS